ncbi:MAG: hypothetical protein ABIP17_06810 [Ilumatobacteraceae bacterium]
MQDDSPWKPPPDDSGADRSGPQGSEQTADDQRAPGPPADPWSMPATTATPSLPDAVPTLGPPPAPVAPPPGSTPIASMQEPDDEAADTVVVRSEPASGSRRSTWLVVGAAAAVIAVVAAGIFAITNLTGSADGGASTPDELGLALLDAIQNEDVLGVIDVLSPGERDVFRDPIVDLVSELKRLDVLSPDADLARILGVDVEFSNVSITSVSTNVDDITNIDMRADAAISLDGAQVPIGSLITDNVPADDLTEMRGTKTTQSDEFDVRLTAIEEGGRWYFSVFHTIAEMARAETAPGSLIPVDGIGAAGAATPEAAVDGVLDRLEALDLAGLVQSLNPGEAAALQRYAPLFVDEGQVALGDLPLDWEITAREFRVEGDGATRTVMIDVIAIEGTIDGTSFSVSFDDGCIRAEAEGETFEQCQDEQYAALDDLMVDAPDARRLIDTITAAFSDMEPVGLELREFDGQWFISPTSTLTEGFLAVLRALDRTELDAIIEQAPAAFDEFGDAFFGGLNLLPGAMIGLDDEFALDEFALDESGASASDDWDGSAGTFNDAISDDPDDPGAGAGGYEERPLDAAWSDCYAEFEPADATDCFSSVSAAGGPELSAMPFQLRFPECGYADSWYTDFYQWPDADFIAAAEAARPCFLDLVTQGAIDEWELPPEIANLECFEGRNWYLVFDDAEYDARYDDCLDAANG